MTISQDNFFTTSDGAHIYYEDRGSGNTLIMIPGFLCTSLFFRKNAEVLAKKFRVITIDPRGQGFSSKTTCGNTVKRHAKDIKELIDHLKLSDVVLLGWSLAASVIVTYANEFNNYMLSGMVMMDGSLFPFSKEEWNHHRGRNYNVQNWHDVYMPLHYNPQEFYDKFFERIGLHREDYEWVKKECMKSMPCNAIELHYDFSHTDNVKNLGKISVPTAFFGAESKDYGLEMIDYFASHVCVTTRIVKFYESGHLMFLYEAEKFNNELTNFMDYVNEYSGV